MGIKCLTKLLRTFAPDSIRQVDLSAYAGKRVAVDANIHLYRYLRGPDQNPSRALYGFLDLARWFRRFDIEAVFVFDGQVKLTAKQPEIERRYNKRKRLIDRADSCRHQLARVQSEVLRKQELTAEPQLRQEEEPLARRWEPSAELQTRALTEELNNLQHQIVYISPSTIHDCQHMLKLAGVPVIVAEHEAEATCSAMAADGQVSAVVSEDMDALAFGGTILLRECRAQRRMAIEIRMEVVLNRLSLTREQFVDVCILCGCDFSSQWRAVSHRDALQCIQRHKDIEGIIAAQDPEDARPLPESFTYEIARDIFLHPPRVSSADLAEALAVKAQHRGLDDFLRLKSQSYRPFRRCSGPENKS